MTNPIPSHHKAITYNNPGQISTSIRTVETPLPGPGEILIHLTHSGVCSSDLGIMTTTVGFPPAPLHQIGGHEGIGTVVAFGPNTQGTTPLEIGDRVGIKWVAYICGVCMSCLSGRDALCEKVRVSGFGTPGTFQEYVVSSASYVTPIPGGLGSEVAAPMLCGGVTVYSALRKSGAQPVGFIIFVAILEDLDGNRMSECPGYADCSSERRATSW